MSVLNTTVNGLDLMLTGNSNVTISNSTLRNLGLQGSSFVTLRNSSVYAGLYVVGRSRVLIYSELSVRCVDYFGNPLDGTVVTVTTGPYARLLGNETTDENGRASFMIFSGMTNATASFPVGIVTVNALYEHFLTSQEVSVASANKGVTISFSLPSWSGYILPIVILVAVVAMLTVVYYIGKRVRGRKEQP
jgi:hypothetical protein